MKIQSGSTITIELLVAHILFRSYRVDENESYYEASLHSP